MDGEQPTPDGTATTVLDHVRVLRARARWVVLGVVLGLLGGVLVAVLVPPTYTAQISMYVAAQDDGDATQAYQGAQLSQARVISYVELVTRPRVTKAVIAQLGLDTTPDELAKDITASSEQDSVLLDVTVATHDPGESVRIANAVGQVFPGAVSELELPLRAGAVPPVVVRVVEPADGAEVTSPAWPVPVAFGLLAGVVAGIFLALLRNATDTSVTSAGSVRAVTGLPLLATTYTDRAGTADTFVPARDTPSSPTADAVRRLRTNLQYLDVDAPPRILAVASSAPAEGKTTLACDLAVALARGGSRVLLVEADLRRPAVAERFGLPRAVGLTDVLAGRLDLADAIQPTEPGAAVLASGPLVPNPGELLASDRMARLVAEAGERFDHVVVDTAPLLTVSDTAAVAPLVDGVLLVCRWGRTSRAELSQSVEALHSVSARGLGVVLTMAPARSAPTDAVGYGNLPAATSAPAPTVTRPAPPHPPGHQLVDHERLAHRGASAPRETGHGVGLERRNP
ncbi:polysaccharide biosynthesis tyrosine autokinase [Actinomycetospora endophytica]|uniref:Polysaccharide biosynthesis tyrosine autokinase n=1 Tax=Actinomycetospora endophytica TaxID=2291215 RepID=A0ABS8P687_9PSEU|nr:polysaccharide biosynthesis tyrosine autokinase [Actinomycetospora endophytica]MCD2193639.1 polysaccharide biosynthesis tyrosine autokinase [Actinomycetospora endophytica]